jgi:hypothetical protein
MAPAAQHVLEKPSFKQTQRQKPDFLRAALPTRQPVESDGQLASLFVADRLDVPAGEQLVPDTWIVVHAPAHVTCRVDRCPATLRAGHLPRQAFFRRPRFLQKVRCRGRRRQPHAFSALAGQVWTEHQSPMRFPAPFWSMRNRVRKRQSATDWSRKAYQLLWFLRPLLSSYPCGVPDDRHQPTTYSF